MARASLHHATLARVVALGGLHHHHFHGPAVDLIAVAIAVTISSLGIPGPGEPALVAAGILSARGRIDLLELLLVAWVAATLGGALSWALGRWGGRRVWEAPGPLLRARKASIAKGARFFDRYGFLAVYLAPSWVSGINGVRATRFLAANAISSAVWTAAVGGGAYLVGPTIKEAIGDLGLVTGVTLLVLVSAAVGTAYRRRRRRRSDRGPLA